LNPRFAGSNLTEDIGFLRVIKIHSITSFTGEIKLLVSRHTICGMLKNAMGMKEMLCRQNSAAISDQVSPALQLDVSAGNCWRALVDESGMIINQMGMYGRSEMVAVQGSLCAPTP
jgi:hypothetical protein